MKNLYVILIALMCSSMLVSADPTTGLQFSGDATSYIDLGQQAAFSPAQFTVEVWINYQTLNDGYIISNEGWTEATGAEGFSLRSSNSNIELVLGANADWNSIKSKTEIQVDEWYHIAATYSGSEMKLYVNGVLDTTQTVASPMITSTQSTSIGEGSMWKGRLLTGKMADLRFWNVVRSGDDISTNMNATLTGEENGLVAAWKMDEGTGTVVADIKDVYHITKPDDVSWFIGNGEQPVEIVAPAKGLVFDGSANSMVDLGADEAIASPAEFTVEALVNYSSVDGGYIISSEGAPTDTTTQGYSLRLNSGRLDFTIGTGENWVGVTAPGEISLETWHHVAATYSSSAMTLYLDGREVASVTDPAAIGASFQNVIIGEGSMWKGRGLRGQLGYIRMWSTARTKEEIRDNANNYVTGSEANLLAAWNNIVQDETVLAEVTNTYPGTIGEDVAWFGFTTGIEPVNANDDIQAFVHGNTLKIANRTNSTLTYSIYNIMGQKLVEGFVGAGGSYQKELNELSGSYILKCSTGNGRVSAKKFIIAK